MLPEILAGWLFRLAYESRLAYNTVKMNGKGGGFMKKMVCAAIVLLTLILSLISCSKKIEPLSEELALMDALQKLQEGADNKISYERFSRLLSTAGDSYETLKRTKNTNSCFLSAANKCYASFKISSKAWRLRDEAKTEKRRIDMDHTLSFSLGFASVSLARAKDCFERK